MVSVRLTLAALAFALAGTATPVLAQSQPIPKLVIYGNQKCPTDASGNEIVVCEHRSQAEQFRIPKELREFKVTPENQSWAVHAQNIDGAAAAGIGSCTTVGAGGSTGCFLQQAQANKLANKERRQAAKDVADALP